MTKRVSRRQEVAGRNLGRISSPRAQPVCMWRCLRVRGASEREGVNSPSVAEEEEENVQFVLSARLAGKRAREEKGEEKNKGRSQF